MSITSDALERLPGVLNKPNTRRLLTLLLTPLDDAITAVDVRAAYSIRNAFGAIQDLLGDLIGARRNGLDNDAYRDVMLYTVAADASDGSVESLVTLADLVLGTSCDIHIVTAGSASVYAHLVSPTIDVDQADLLLTFLQQAANVGIRVSLLYSTEADESLLFRFGKSVYLSAPSTAGDIILNIKSPKNFPATGTVVINQAQPDEETIAYNAIGPATMSLTAPTAFSHGVDSVVMLVAAGLGLGTTTDSGAGGKLISALSRSRS